MPWGACLSVAPPEPVDVRPAWQRASALLWPLALVLVVAVLFAGAPRGGAFYWPDSPRHALNGAFVMDLIAAFPVGDPMGFAYAYYTQYPALTILLYPPLLSFALAPFYAVFGVSQETALLVLFIFYCALALSAYGLARLWLPRAGAFGVALILVAAPEIAFWGRQVMLEIPAFAFVVWSAVFLVRHLRVKDARSLYASAAFLVLAMYTKLSVTFLVAPYAVAILLARGWSIFRDPHTYLIGAAAIVGLLPLIFLTVEFGQANVTSVIGIADADVSRFSLHGWIWYAKKLPFQIGWPPFLLALAFVLWAFWRRDQMSTSAPEGMLLIAWFIFGYLYYSAIDLKEARHSVFLLLPVALWSGMALYRWLPAERLAGGATIALGIVTLATTLVTRPVLYVDGYDDVVAFIAEKAPQDSVVLFSGYRDGAFIFNLRTHEERRDLTTLRADKLLLQIAVRRALGVKQKDYTEAEISDLLNRLGVHYVVAEPDFWIDLEQKARLQSVLHSDQFEEVRRFDMHANYPAQEKELVVYRNLGDVAEGPHDIVIDLPIIDRQISGSTRKTGD